MRFAPAIPLLAALLCQAAALAAQDAAAPTVPDAAAETADLGAELARLMAQQADVALAPEEMAGLEFPVSAWQPELLDRLFAGPNLLDPAFDTGVPPAPANDSLETQVDLLQLLELQASGRTGREVTLAQLEGTPGLLPADRFQIEGIIPERAVFPELWDLLDLVNDEVLWFSMREKMRYSRARPSTLEPALTPLIAVPPHPAYPSGHSGHYHAASLVLGALNPPCAAAYETFADEVARRREILGVHYPSDSAAGKILGRAVAQALLEGGQVTPLIEALGRAARERGIDCPSCAPPAAPEAAPAEAQEAQETR